MKIGEFAEIHGVSVDTVRFYIENELLLPERIHNQYSFDEKCSLDLREVLELKSMKFTLSEIKKIFSFRKLENLLDNRDIIFYKNLYGEKHAELLGERESIDDALALIEKKLESIDEKNSETGRLGVPFGFLKNLACPDCMKELSMDRVAVQDNMIYEASLSCTCGYAASIEDGVLITPSANYNVNETVENGGAVEQFVNDYGSTYVNFLSKPVEWIRKRLLEEKLENGTLLELGTGKAFFLSRVLADLGEGITYIATDIDY